MSRDDTELTARLRAGEQAAYAELMRVHGPRLIRVARRLMRSEEDARDCFQESMVTVARRIGSFKEESSLGTWLYRIVVNNCLMKLRKASSRSEQFIDDLMPTFDKRDCRIGESEEPIPTPDSLLQREQTRRQVRDAIEALPDGYRSVLMLRDIEDRPAAEVAEMLSISSALVNVRLHRARSALKKLLEPVLHAEAMIATPAVRSAP